MANTMTLITSYEVTGSTQAVIDIASIPSTYTDLWIKFSSRHTTAGSEDTPSIRFNNDATSNYTFVFGGYWNSTAAINRIQMQIVSGYQFALGTTIYIYGIKNS